MKIKKISAPNMAEAMQIVKQELGENAVILNSKTVETGGLFGLFKRKSVEVIAALDEKEKEAIMPPSAKQSDPRLEQETLAELTKQWQNQKKGYVEPTASSTALVEPRMQQSNRIPHSRIVEILRAQELNQTMIEAVLKNYDHVQVETEYDVCELLSFNLKNIFRDFKFGGITYTKKYVNVVGPTGVGKTTTLAKLAAKCVLVEGKKAAFITTDTYRIAAIEQLRTYAQILSMPLEVCYTLEDFQAAKKKFQDYDVVFIDSAGRNFLDHENVLNLTKIIDYKDNVETFLVFSLTGKYSDMKKIYSQFASIPIYKFIFTKLDETRSYGAMFNLMNDCRIGIAYLTNGQNVPDDVIDVDLTYAINLFIEGYKYERSS